jgi:hypothetical protein
MTKQVHDLVRAPQVLERDAPPRTEAGLSAPKVQEFGGRAPSMRLPAASVVSLIGAAAVGFSMLYLVSDLIELGQGGFSTLQLALTYISEATIPLFVIGIYAVQRPRIGWLGLLGAVGYAYAFVFFSSTVVYALVDDVPDWNALLDRMGAWMTVHSVLMVASGFALGFAVRRARVLPAWTGTLLIVGMFAMVCAAVLPDVFQVAAAAVRDMAFAAMGASLLASARTGWLGGRGWLLRLGTEAAR